MTPGLANKEGPVGVTITVASRQMEADVEMGEAFRGWTVTTRLIRICPWPEAPGPDCQTSSQRAIPSPGLTGKSLIGRAGG